MKPGISAGLQVEFTSEEQVPLLRPAQAPGSGRDGKLIQPMVIPRPPSFAPRSRWGRLL